MTPATPTDGLPLPFVLRDLLDRRRIGTFKHGNTEMTALDMKVIERWAEGVKGIIETFNEQTTRIAALETENKKLATEAESERVKRIDQCCGLIKELNALRDENESLREQNTFGSALLRMGYRTVSESKADGGGGAAPVERNIETRLADVETALRHLAARTHSPQEQPVPPSDPQEPTENEATLTISPDAPVRAEGYAAMTLTPLNGWQYIDRCGKFWTTAVGNAVVRDQTIAEEIADIYKNAQTDRVILLEKGVRTKVVCVEVKRIGDVEGTMKP